VLRAARRGAPGLRSPAVPSAGSSVRYVGAALEERRRRAPKARGVRVALRCHPRFHATSYVPTRPRRVSPERPSNVVCRVAPIGRARRTARRCGRVRNLSRTKFDLPFTPTRVRNDDEAARVRRSGPRRVSHEPPTHSDAPPRRAWNARQPDSPHPTAPPLSRRNHETTSDITTRHPSPSRPTADPATFETVRTAPYLRLRAPRALVARHLVPPIRSTELRSATRSTRGTSRTAPNAEPGRRACAQDPAPTYRRVAYAFPFTASFGSSHHGFHDIPAASAV